MNYDKLSLRSAPLVFVDTETTGLRPDLGHRLVEIALLRTEGLTEVKRFSSLVNPQRLLEPSAIAVNKITPDMVADAPTFADILPEVHRMLDGAVIVMHNAPFDMGFLESEYRIAKDDSLSPDAILDTLMLARRQYHFRSNSLGNIAQTLNIPTSNAHRAMGDVLTTFEVFRRFSGDLTRQNRPLVQDWIRMQGGTVWRPQNFKLPASHPIQIALDTGKKLLLLYETNRGKTSNRMIEPLSVSGNYLVAYCHLRQDQRTFRLDRIISMELID